MEHITIYPGYDKNRRPEAFSPLTLQAGELCAIVGNTGSGKSRLLKDMEQLVDRDSVTGRRIALDNAVLPPARRLELSGRLIAHLSQNMRFVLDLTVEEFLRLHISCRKKDILPELVIAAANTITPEAICSCVSLNRLSGGHSRALMIADIAMICDSPIVLVDEIENAGINKKKALELLTGNQKLVFIVTHDPHTALMAPRRLVMKNGAVASVIRRTDQELLQFHLLDQMYEKQTALQSLLRKGTLLI